MSETPSLTPLRRWLGGLRGRLRRSVAADGLARLLGAVLVAGLVSFACDYLLELDRLGRLILGLLLVGGVAWVARTYLLVPLSKSLPDVALASLVERRHPELSSVLSSALDFERALSGERAKGGDVDGADPQMMRDAIEEAVAALRDRRELTRGLLVGGFVWKRLGAILLVLAAGWGALHLAGDLAGIWFQRSVLLRDVPWPKPTTLVLVDFEDGVRRVAQGDSAEVTVRAEGLVPSRVWLEADFDDGGSLREPMGLTAEDGVFSFQLESLVVGCTVRVTSRRAHPAEGTIVLVPRPQLSELVAALEFPAYLGREGEVHPDPAVLEIPAGTTVRLSAQADKPLAAAWTRLGDERTDLALSTPQSFEGRLQPATSGILELRVRDEDGLDQETPPRIELTVNPDAAPDVTLLPKGVSQIITSQAQINYSVSAEDDHGLVRAELVLTAIRADGQEEEPLRSLLSEGASGVFPELSTTGLCDVAPFAFEPGHQLRMVAEATDANRETGPGVGSSETFELRVVSVPDFMTEMHRRQLELRREFERAVGDQGKLVGELRELVEGTSGDSPKRSEPAQLERIERAIGRRTAAIAARFRQILEELETNQLAEDRDRERIGEEIARPLEDVAAGPLRIAGEELAESDRLAQAGTANAESLEQALAAADQAWGVMRGILESMLKQETYSEVLSILRDVIRLHQEAGSEVEKERRRRILDVLEGEDE